MLCLIDGAAVDILVHDMQDGGPQGFIQDFRFGGENSST